MLSGFIPSIELERMAGSLGWLFTDNGYSSVDADWNNGANCSLCIASQLSRPRTHPIAHLPFQWLLFTLGIACFPLTVRGSAANRCLSLNFALYFKFRGFVLSLYPQHGHQRPFQFMNISHIWHLFWPLLYLPAPDGFCALWRMQIPLHTMIWRQHHLLPINGYYNKWECTVLQCTHLLLE